MDVFGLDSVQNEPLFGPLDPIESIDYEDEEALLNWARKCFDALSEHARPRQYLGRANVCRYKGYYSKYEPVIDSKNNPALAQTLGLRSKWPRIITNHTRNLVDQKVAKLMKIEPDTDVLPNNAGETEDKISSLTARKVIQTVKYRHNYRDLYTRFIRRSILHGEAYLQVCWDPEMGELKPDVLSAVNKLDSDDLFLKDSDYGVTVPNQDGTPTYVELLPRIGDVSLKLLDPECVYLIPGATNDLSDCLGVCIVEFVHVFHLRAKYPKLADEIAAAKELYRFNLNTLDEDLLENRVAVFHWYFKTSNFLPWGLYFCNTSDTILKTPYRNPIPYSPALGLTQTSNLPIVRLTDVEIDGWLHGWSSMNDIAQLQVFYDKFTSWMSKNIFQYCTPKWTAQRGSCDPNQLGPGAPYVMYTGPSAPTLQTFTAVTQEQMALRDDAKQNMGQLAGVYQHSLGEAPTGTRSASQLMIYDEQEEEARDTFRHKVEACAVSTDTKVLVICSKNYEKNDKRLIQIVGDNQEWIVEPFDPEDLRKDYVVQIKPTGALPENKYAKIRTLSEIMQTVPGAISPQQYLHMIKFGQDDKLLDYTTVAIIAAEHENEKLLQGKEVDPPERYEDLTNHWKVHTKLVQNFNFKKLTKKQQKNILEHLGATEALMFAHAKDNPTYQQFIYQAMPTFPLVYIMPPTPLGMPTLGGGGAPAPQGAPQQGAQASNGSNKPPTMGLNGEPRDPSQRQPVP
jgi:hypothetical protein